MNITSVVETTFTGAHTVAGHPLCGERHGHTWRVRVEIAGDEKDLVDGSLADVFNRVAEYHNRDLDRFLPGVRTTPPGLAAFFRERLSEFPVAAIEVTENDGRGVRVEWPVR